MIGLDFRWARLPRRQLSLLAVVTGAFALFAAGCGRTGPEVVPVVGTITFGGGSWPKPGVVNFVVDTPSPGLPNRPAMGLFDASGQMTVTTYKKGDGLIPGKYKIGVECWEVRPEMMSPGVEKSYVPTQYGSPSTSGFSVVVEPGQKVVKLNLDVPKK
jgi:hypothetical protein